MPLAQYLLRFDDICPGMQWTRWNKVECILVDEGIRPIVAVVPDNRNAILNCDLPLGGDEFWGRVRRWQSFGWSIALHGYQHIHETSCSGIIGINPVSEFAGLPYEKQLRKLAAGLAIFERNGVTADAWVAPGHSFDNNTLLALEAVNIRTVSDGFTLLPYSDLRERFWVPQQLWRFRPMPFGVWTVCMHTNAWSESDVARFERDIVKYRRRITDLDAIRERYRNRRRRHVDLASDLAARLLIRVRRHLFKGAWNVLSGRRPQAMWKP